MIGKSWVKRYLKIEIFKMERWQSTYENVVRYNLTESGVHPLTVRELVGDESHILAETSLGYGYTNGTPELRELISQLYRGRTPRSVLVTNGSSEANFISILRLVERGDEVVLMLPNYMQIWGIARSMGAKVRTFRLVAENAWALDVEQLKSLVGKQTKLIAVCNPNNPTGAVLSTAEMNAIRDLASESRAWILSDEVYQGAEINGRTTQSFLDIYDRTIVTNGLSKAYGLPGLRIGWIAGPESTIAKLWSYHDYTTIAPSSIGDRLARVALKKRSEILERTRNILRTNRPILEQWVNQTAIFSFVKPKAGAISFARYGLKVNSTRLAEKLLEQRSVLVVPGDHLGIDGYLRIGYGAEPSYLKAGLDLIGQFAKEWPLK